MIKIYLNGGELKKLIKIRHLRQKDVAQRLGITHIHFSRLLKGNHEPAPKIRKELTKMFCGHKWERLFKMVSYTLTSNEMEDI